MKTLSNNLSFILLILFLNPTKTFSYTSITNIQNHNLSTNDFVITWDTTKEGISNNSSITIPTTLGIYYYNVDWNNDGVFDDLGLTNSTTHDFKKPGIYTIRISGIFPHFSFNNTGDKLKLIAVNQWGTQKWLSMNGTFWGCKNLVGKASDKPDLSNVVDMDGMFENAKKFNQYIGDWDTSTINNMASLLSGATSFNQDINNWDTSNVNNMSFMFNQAKSFNQSLNKWDTSNVINMKAMFQLTINFNGEIGNWNTEKVINMEFMFSQAYAFNQNINKWDTKNVEDISMMFQGAFSFNQNISHWNIQKVIKMDKIFYRANNFKQDLKSWNTNNKFNNNLLTSK